MLVEMCKQLCMGNRYLGLQYSFECFCGNSLDNSGVYNETTDSECNRGCLGNSSQICGGNYRNSVYEYINCTSPGLNEYTITSTNTNFVPSTEVTYTCAFGYQLPAGDLGTRICQLGGTWLAPPPVCVVAPASNTEIITSVVTSTELTTPETSTVTTEPTVKTSALSTDWTVTALLKKSEVTTVQPISSLECTPCPCSKVGKGKWDFLRGMNLTLDQLRVLLKPELDLMKKELSVNKYNTSRMRRSKTSAPDDRVSATSIGYVGVVVICFITFLIVLFDILGCFVGKFKRRSLLQL
ncbi:uncharacterized protein [Mytilus edulis]|uniref:uncharacterized protein n=1 Tax=Mytilus edulis TaxID=6550 RepID=UPI0039EE74B4